MPSVPEWLGDLGLHEYAEMFEQNNIDSTILPHLTKDDLVDIGISSVGHRRILLDAIAKLSRSSERHADEDDTVTAAPGAAAPDAQRRQMTILFCDLVGSTALSQRLDPEDLRDVMRIYEDAVASAVARYQGHVAKYLGDGVLAYFGWPIAFEDQAERAIRAGLDAVAAIPLLSLQVDEKLAARVGIGSGEVVVGDIIAKDRREEGAVSGETPNLAARLQGLAKPNQVVVSEATRRLVGNAFQLKSIGEHELKGFVAPIPAWIAVGDSAAEGRFEATGAASHATFVGREHEIGLLHERWNLAKKGEGQVVTVVGEVGIGKSRTVRALEELIESEPHARIFFQCSAHHTNSAFHPVIQQLEREASITSGDGADERLNKLEALLETGGPQVLERAAYFVNLLSIDGVSRYGELNLSPANLRQCIIDSIVDRILTIARRETVLLIVEDAHWIDPTTSDLLQHIATCIADAPVMIVATYRYAEGGVMELLPHATLLTLNRLSRAQGKDMIRAAATNSLPDEVVDRIAARTDGVPIYIEELTRLVGEAGADAARIAIPTTLQASLLARLDLLGDAKEVSQIGAVVGREFGRDLLASVLDCPAHILDAALEKLVQSELVFRRPDGANAVYVFKHALMQDAAYQSLLRSTRQIQHKKVAEIIEKDFAEIATTQPELLARHYTEAGEFERAIKFWYRAGQLAIRHSADVEAVAHLSKGLELLTSHLHGEDRAATELDFCLALGPALMATKGLASQEAEKVYLQARELCKEVGDPVKSFSATWGLWQVSQQRGRLDMAMTLTGEVLALAKEQKGDTDRLLQAHHAAWTTELVVGKISSSREHAVKGAELYDCDRHRSHAFTYGGHDPGVCAMTTISESLCLLGYVDQAIERAADAVSLAEKISHPYSLAMARCFAAQLRQHRLEPELVQQHAGEAIELCEAHGFESLHAKASILLGWAVATSGDTAFGTEKIRDGIATLRATGTEVRLSYFLALLADTLLRSKLAEEGLKVVDEAEILMKESGVRRWMAETLRVKAELMTIANAKREQIEETYRAAFDIAREQEAMLLQLRTASSLARMLRDCGDPDSARDFLEPVFAWFTEGSDTPDVRDASALVDELQR